MVYFVTVTIIITTYTVLKFLLTPMDFLNKNKMVYKLFKSFVFWIIKGT